MRAWILGIVSHVFNSLGTVLLIVLLNSKFGDLLVAQWIDLLLFVTAVLFLRVSSTRFSWTAV